MTAWVEPGEPGWAPRQLLLTALKRLGYRVDAVGIGGNWRLVLS